MSWASFLTSAGLPLAVIMPLAAALLALALSAVWKRAGSYITLLAVAANLVLAGLMVKFHLHGTAWMGGWNPVEMKGASPLFTHIGGVALSADGLTVLMLLLVATISFLVTIYARSYMEPYTAKNRFFGLFLLMIAGMNGCLVAGDLFTFWISLEIASLASYALVGFGTESEELEAAFKYLVLGALGSVFFLFAMVLTWGAFGTLNMAELSAKLLVSGGLGKSPIMLLAAAFLLVGVGLKAAMVPFHAWLPDAHPSAPTPISAMLSGLIIKVLGIYAFARIFVQVLDGGSVSSLGTMVIWLGVLSMVVGVLMAVGQWDFKRLLAYHSISQMGYVIAALGLVMVLAGPLDCSSRQVQVLNRITSELKVELSTWQPVLASVEQGMTDPAEIKVAGGVEGLRKRVREMQGRLETAERDKAEVQGRMDAVKPADKARFQLALSLALLGAIFHLVNHAFFKSLLFLCAGAIERATGTRNLKELGGLWSKMPYTSTSCAVAALSISGVPPFNGFWSKLLIIWAAALAGHWGLAAVAVLVSFLTLISFVKVQKYALFGPMSARVLRGAREVPWPMCLSMVTLAAGCLVVGVLFMLQIGIPDLLDPAVKALGGGPVALLKLLQPLGFQ